MKTILTALLILTGLHQLHSQANDSLTQIYSKFDFVPGEKVIFFDDFSSENIGDFPLLWNTTGSGEVVSFSKYPGRWFKITNARGITTLADTLKLPDNYTIEFDIVPQKDPGNNARYVFYLFNTSKPKDLKYGLARPGGTGIWFEFAYNSSYFAYYQDGTPNLSGRVTEPKQTADTRYHISIWVQKERIRFYQDEVKLFDLAKAVPKAPRYNMIRFDGVPLIANVRIATGLPDMRNKLLSEGKLVSYGIYFDVNSDKIKPQSAGTLKEIASILTDNPSLRIKITGHTDADGDDAANLELSKRRAEAVKTALSASYGIAETRIETDGKGEKEPVAANDNVTNKALNRRVEFIKL